MEKYIFAIIQSIIAALCSKSGKRDWQLSVKITQKRRGHVYITPSSFLTG
nr:hypothetical protein [Odoribacter splanchnicus]